MLLRKKKQCGRKRERETPPVESRLQLLSTTGTNSSLVRDCKCIESRMKSRFKRTTRCSPQVCYILVPLLTSPPRASVCVLTGADSLLKTPGWRKVWAPHTSDREQFLLLSLRSTFTRSSSSSSKHWQSRWLGRVWKPKGTGPLTTCVAQLKDECGHESTAAPLMHN